MSSACRTTKMTDLSVSERLGASCAYAKLDEWPLLSRYCSKASTHAAQHAALHLLEVQQLLLVITLAGAVAAEPTTAIAASATARSAAGALRLQRRHRRRRRCAARLQIRRARQAQRLCRKGAAAWAACRPWLPLICCCASDGEARPCLYLRAQQHNSLHFRSASCCRDAPGHPLTKPTPISRQPDSFSTPPTPA